MLPGRVHRREEKKPLPPRNSESDGAARGKQRHSLRAFVREERTNSPRMMYRRARFNNGEIRGSFPKIAARVGDSGTMKA